MTPWQITLLGAYSLVLALVAWRHVVCHRTLRKTTALTPMPPRPWETDDYWPFVSILIPAKDEAESIEDCVRSLLAQDYPHFEVLVVDDRSADETAGIVERLVRDDRRVRLVRVGELPSGWTGKSHALHTGRQQARGDWFLFVDADTRHDPSCLTAVMRHALQRRADMVSLLPALESETFWENVIQPSAGRCLRAMYPVLRANNPKRLDGGFANGQFLLVGRCAYEQIGGHAAVRDKLAEDIHLGRNARRAGLRLRIAIGSAVLRIRGQAALPAIVSGWSRILYAAAECRPAPICALAAVFAALSVLPYGVVAGCGGAMFFGIATPFLKTALALGVAHEALQLALDARARLAARSPLRWLAFRWLGAFAMLYILCRALGLCRMREVAWRGTTYGRDFQTPPSVPSPGRDRKSAAA